MAEKKIVNDIFGTRVTLCQECKTGRHVKTGKLFHTAECIEDHTINSDLHEQLKASYTRNEEDNFTDLVFISARILAAGEGGTTFSLWSASKS